MRKDDPIGALLCSSREQYAAKNPGLIKSGVLHVCAPGVPAILLDRDGVLNRKVNDGYVLAFDAFEFNEPLIEVLARHSRATRMPIVVVSNQRCVSRRLITDLQLRELMELFTAALASRGVELAGWYCCPHADDDACACRKPSPGMLMAAAADFAFDLGTSCLVGDSESDIVAGARAGVGTCVRYDMERPGDASRVAAMLGALYGR